MAVMPDFLRPGDLILVQARVERKSAGNFKPLVNEMVAIFKNGDSLPLKSVDVHSVNQHDLKEGDMIIVLDSSDDSAKVLGEAKVMAVFDEANPKQVAYKSIGQWPINVTRIDCVRRIS